MSVWPARIQLLEPIVLVAVTQVDPLSKETCTISPATVPVLRVPLMVCASVLVIKSVLLSPVSDKNSCVAMMVVGEV